MGVCVNCGQGTSDNCPYECGRRKPLAEVARNIPGPVGWSCPACGKGNAPAAALCGHCA